MAPLVLSGAAFVGSCGEQADPGGDTLVESFIFSDAGSDAFIEGINDYIKDYGCEITRLVVEPIEVDDLKGDEDETTGLVAAASAGNGKIVVDQHWLSGIFDLREATFVGYHEAGHVCSDSDANEGDFSRFKEPYELDFTEIGNDKFTIIGSEAFSLVYEGENEEAFRTIALLEEAFVNLLALKEYGGSPSNDGYIDITRALGMAIEDKGLSLEQANEWRLDNDIHSFIGAMYSIDKNEVTPGHVRDFISLIAASQR